MLKVMSDRQASNGEYSSICNFSEQLFWSFGRSVYVSLLLFIHSSLNFISFLYCCLSFFFFPLFFVAETEISSLFPLPLPFLSNFSIFFKKAIGKKNSVNGFRVTACS